MNFEQTSAEIIKEYIQSGLCIDNDYSPPYSRNEEEKNKDNEIPEKLYYSFREKGNCDLDIYSYENQNQWNKVKEYAYNSKDLLVLDWELTNDEPKFRDALEILAEAIESKTIQFVIIYTRVPDLTEVELNILAFFGPLFSNESELESKIQEIVDYVNSDKRINNPEKFIEKAKISLKDIAISNSKESRKKAKTSFVNAINELYDGDQTVGYQIVDNFIKKAADIMGLNEDKGNLFLGPLLNNKILNTNRKQNYSIMKFDAKKMFYSINNTVIMIFQNEKSGVANYINAEDVFTEFSKVIYKNPHSFITLLSLEMKGLYRSKISLLGKEMLKINERAFFYQMDNYQSKEEFYDFLINSWNNEINNFSRENLPSLLDTIQEYRKNNNLEKIDITQHYNELVKMGFLLSCFTDKKPDKKIIKFGDIFKWLVHGTDNKYFFLNITQHCDCLRPEKINNNFHFIVCKKEIPNLNTALNNVEKDHYTFIHFDKPFVIEWDTKPFTMYIQNNVIENNSIVTTYLGKDITLEYFTTLKENFTQRLANHSFGYSMRIGINHPHLRKT